LDLKVSISTHISLYHILVAFYLSTAILFSSPKATIRLRSEVFTAIWILMLASEHRIVRLIALHEWQRSCRTIKAQNLLLLYNITTLICNEVVQGLKLRLAHSFVFLHAFTVRTTSLHSPWPATDFRKSFLKYADQQYSRMDIRCHQVAS
jgi:hypothetical protein